MAEIAEAPNYSDALSNVLKAAGVIFDSDPSVRSVGVGDVGYGVGYIAVRNVKAATPYKATISAKRRLKEGPLEEVGGFPISYIDCQTEPQHYAKVPHATLSASGGGSSVPEQQNSRPLVGGLQIQNIDDDVRTGTVAQGEMTVGSIGCFVKLRKFGNRIAILSNNHVVRGTSGVANDIILQQGSTFVDSTLQAATLIDWVHLNPSVDNAAIVDGNVILNQVDGGVAELSDQSDYTQGYLPVRAPLTGPTVYATASAGDQVFKIGRTTGLQWGTVKSIGHILKVRYDGVGDVWFEKLLIIEGDNGALFADHGDSGAAIMRKSDNAMVGLLFAGIDDLTYACDINEVMSQLNCSLA